MDNQQFENRLARLGITFHWYEFSNLWWACKIRPGNTSRSTPAGAKSRATAEIEAIKLIRRQYRDT